jgi:uncharacterized protein YbcI
MDGPQTPGTSPLTAVSNALVKLHKEQFGRGPNTARSYFAGPDILVCMLQDVLLPAERKLVELGDQNRVRDSRVAFQAATQDDFITAVEHIIARKVAAFASGIDADNDVVFETFYLNPRSSDGGSDGASTAERAGQLGRDGQVGV